MKIRVPGVTPDLKKITYLGKCANCKAIVETSFEELHLRGLTAPENHGLRNGCPSCHNEVTLWRAGTANHELLTKEVLRYEVDNGILPDFTEDLNEH